MSNNDIEEFAGPFGFLSNFYPCEVHWGIVFEDTPKNDDVYKTAEHAFQAAKANTMKDRRKVQACETPGQAKRMGRLIKLKSNWEDIKLRVMYEVVKDKFTRNKELRQKLLRTGQRGLVEFNTWHDTTWGKCSCPEHAGEGQNELGKILMRVRDELRKGK